MINALPFSPYIITKKKQPRLVIALRGDCITMKLLNYYVAALVVIGPER